MKKVDGDNGVTRTLPTISTRSSQKDPLEQEPMPSLRPVRGNRTPVPSPPKLLNIPGETYEDHSDPFHPLDHTNPESPINLALLSKVAAAINTDDDDNSSIVGINIGFLKFNKKTLRKFRRVFGLFGYIA